MSNTEKKPTELNNKHLIEVLGTAQIFHKEATGIYSRMTAVPSVSDHVTFNSEPIPKDSIVLVDCDEKGAIIGEPYLCPKGEFTANYFPVVRKETPEPAAV